MTNAWPPLLAASIETFRVESRDTTNRLVAFRTLVGTDKFPAAFAAILDSLTYMSDLASRANTEEVQPPCCWKDAFDGGVEGCKDLQQVCEEHVPVASKSVAKKTTKEAAKKAIILLAKDKSLPRIQERFSNLRAWLERMDCEPTSGQHHSH